LLDRSELDASSAPSALVRIDVPARWLEEGGTLVVDVPKRITCAACDGGGCSRCENAGAFRLSDQDVAAPIRVRLAASAAASKRVRIPSPFGDQSASPIGLLFLELRPAETPSAGARFEEERRALARAEQGHVPQPLGPNTIIALVTGLVVAIVVLIVSLSR
jgi:hypothetical protein